MKDDEVIIVDEFTGRKMPGRRWSDGLHQAIEAKESVKIERENQTLATITFQNYFRMYKKLSGMTGTAETEAAEFGKIYDLDVVSIPTNRHLIRLENPDIVYRTEAEKYHAVVNGIMQEDDSFAAGIKQINEIGQPILVGTISIEKSEQLAEQLKRAGVPHQILNAKQHERESRIIAQAGRKGAVTVATNMAGRGTDILLGGNPEFLAREYCLKNRIAIPYAAAPAVIGALPESAAGKWRERNKRLDNQHRRENRPARNDGRSRRAGRIARDSRANADGALSNRRQNLPGSHRPMEADLRRIRAAVQS